ncbi:MAG: ornithine cyclodeaminase family protein [Pikeienuella sp.]|uniref:ornithine cyclodeaminase family protein n=1 Tax=Pikeienuella sp. TaxID=2831957 RepID=UPI0039188BED
MILVGAEEIGRLGFAAAEAALREPMIDLSEGRAIVPARCVVNLGGGDRLGLMPGAWGGVHGVKVLSLFPGNPAKGRSSHLGHLLLFDRETGETIAALEADALTALRTAAMTCLATRALARPGPRHFAILGAGEQAAAHLAAFRARFEPEEIRIWARRPERAAALIAAAGPERLVLAETLERALAGADVVTALTAARAPFLPGRLLQPGQHVNLVGASLADQREIDDEGVARARLFTDSRESASREAGEIIGARASGAILDDVALTEIGAVLSGAAPGRGGAGELTLYKSHGVIVQDLAVGLAVLRARG